MRFQSTPAERSPPTAGEVNEATPLLGGEPEPLKWKIPVLYRALFCGFLVSLSFGVTQVPLIYVFRLMTCDEYYKKHPIPVLSSDRCKIPEIEAVTAREVSILGFSTTLFGVANLFVTGHTIKTFGIKSAIAIQVFWPAARLTIQNVGVMVGGRTGILIVQCSQIITIIGGPAGYLLALNSFVTEVVKPSERTGALGRLQGGTMTGTAIGYLVGGLMSDIFGIITPFRVALALFLLCTVYVVTCLPWIPRDQLTGANSSKGLARFFGPLKMFKPQRWIMANGTIRLEYGALLVGLGVFFGVLATGYIPVLLQMYSTDVFGFGTTENGYLISVYSLLRGLFLMIAFPRLISMGRKLSSRRNQDDPPKDPPQDPANLATVDPMENDEELEEPVKQDDRNQTFEFDLLYTKISLIADGVLTGAATFVRQGWQLYLLAVLLPFAAGTGSAAKGTILQMCPDIERSEALSGITLIDMIARLSTTSIFGLLFAIFATIGQPHLVFACNAGVAFLASVILLFARFPLPGSSRYVEESSIEE